MKKSIKEILELSTSELENILLNNIDDIFSDNECYRMMFGTFVRKIKNEEYLKAHEEMLANLRSINFINKQGDKRGI